MKTDQGLVSKLRPWIALGALLAILVAAQADQLMERGSTGKAPGYQTLITHIFRSGDEYLDSDVVSLHESDLVRGLHQGEFQRDHSHHRDRMRGYQ